METGKKDTQLHFFVSERERELIENNMQRSGMRNMSAYLRKTAIEGYIVQLDLSDVKALVRLLGNVSGNVNQIAKRANETHNIYESDVSDLREGYGQIWDMVNDVIKKLSVL